jgi:hypothetical protein
VLAERSLTSSSASASGGVEGETVEGFLSSDRTEADASGVREGWVEAPSDVAFEGNGRYDVVTKW